MIEAVKPENEESRLELLNELGLLDTPVEERYERITRMVCRSLDVPISAVSLVDHERQWFKSIHGLNVAETDRCIAFCSHAILDTDPFIVNDARDDVRFEDNPLVTGEPNIRFYAGIPLILKGNLPIGTLCAIDTEPRELSQGDLEVLIDLAEMVKSEICNVRLTEAHRALIAELEKAERAAMIDSLTRLWNRRAAENLLMKEFEAAKRSRQKLGVALIDVDSFKQVNDEHGHNYGDDVLRYLSKTLLSSIRPYDSLCRWGGDEFLVVLPNIEKDALDQTLARIVKNVQNDSILKDLNCNGVTVSIGGCVVDGSKPFNLLSVVNEADAALYTAKKDGRNRHAIQ